MAEGEFRKKANTGDLILFSGIKLTCKIQRFFTQSRFGNLAEDVDHVGMLLRYENSKLYLLEATNGDGVKIIQWNDYTMKEYQAAYNRIIYRELSFKRNDSKIKDLETFLNVIQMHH